MRASGRHGRSVVRGIWPLAWAHRASFAVGLGAALAVVGARLVLPWTLKAALKPLLSAGQSAAGAGGESPSLTGPLLFAAVSFLVLLVIMGYADYRERLSFARFAITVIHDLRSRAVGAIGRILNSPAGSGVRQGDIIARLIGDTARIKAGLKGFLVHVATNGAMAIGVSVVLISIDPALGLVFTVGVVLTVLVTWRAAGAVYRQAAKYRAKEGALAEFLHSTHSERTGSESFTSGSSESASHEARITCLQGRATWAAHTIFGATVLGCLLVGMAGARSGRIEPSHLVVFALYALMMRAPLVQLTRQGVRTGKIVACLERVLEIVNMEPAATRDTGVSAVLKSRLRLRDARVRLGKRQARRNVLRIDLLEIAAGQRVAVIGPQGSGKTMLLQLLAGSQRSARGRLDWDEHEWDLAKESFELAGRSCLVPALPAWPRQPLRNTLGITASVTDDQALELVRACGAAKALRRMADGLDSRVSSEDLSLGERKQIALARALLQPAPPLLLIDDIAAGLSKRAARKAVLAVLEHIGQRTLVMTFSRPIRIQRFDRIIELRSGRIAADAGDGAVTEASADSGVEHAGTELQL